MWVASFKLTHPRYLPTVPSNIMATMPVDSARITYKNLVVMFNKKASGVFFGRNKTACELRKTVGEVVKTGQ